MDSNFSPKVKEIISYSREEALRLGNDFIGTEHLLLGLLREDKQLANRFLRSHAARVPLASRRGVYRPGADRLAHAGQILHPGSLRGSGHSSGGQSTRAQSPSLCTQGQERHFPVHVRWAQPGRYIRL